MLHNKWSKLFPRWLYLGTLVILAAITCSACAMKTTYSIDEEYNLWATRSPQMSGQLEFSFRLTPDQVPVGQDIFFVAVFTNTTDQPIVFREPRQHGVMEIPYPDTTLLFDVEPINVKIPFRYPLEGWPTRLSAPIERDEFVMLPPRGKREVRLKLPNQVFRKSTREVIFLPPGQHLVHMTYDSSYIGYEVERKEEWRYVDLGAWVGRVEAEPALLTITP